MTRVGWGGRLFQGRFLFFFFLKEGFKSERSTRWGKKFWVGEQTGRSVLLSGTDRTISRCGRKDGW